jgi:hypothetical protein
VTPHTTNAAVPIITKKRTGLNCLAIAGRLI